MEVKILKKNGNGKYTQFLMKAIKYKKEWHGDRVRIISYHRDLVLLNGTSPISAHGVYIGFDNSETQQLYNLLRFDVE